MNVQTPFGQPERVKLDADAFWLLRRSGAFAGYTRSKLIEGELWGTPAPAEDEPESDAKIPIKVETAATDPKWDLGEMLGLYAAAGIGEYWVLDLKKRAIYQMWSPPGRDLWEPPQGGAGRAHRRRDRRWVVGGDGRA